MNLIEILKLYYETARLRFSNMLRKVDLTKFENLNLKLQTLGLKLYINKLEPESFTSEALI